jgi:transcriptional regulator with XRE-family HTH domain
VSEAQTETRRLIQLIQAMQRILGISNRDLERKLKLSPSYLSRLFNGLIELRFEHIVKLVPAMGLRLEEFFWIAYPRAGRPPSEAARRIRELFDLFETEVGQAPTPAHLERLIEDAVREVLTRVGSSQP